MRKILVVTALITWSQLHAQKDTSAESKTLDPVIMTANRFAQKESETGKVVTIINRSMIDKMGGRTVSEILSTVSGTYVIGSNNNLGTNERVSIRGSSDGNVLILIDGIPVNDPSVLANYFDLNFINTAQIERIEILKGAQSTIYGSDAVSGVINIIMRKATTNGLAPYGTISYGSYSTFNASAGLQCREGNLHYNVFGSAITSKGFSSAFDSTEKANFDNDGYHQYAAHADIGISLSKKIDLTIYDQYSYYKSGLDQAAYTDETNYTVKTKDEQAGLSLLWRQVHGSLHFNYAYNNVNRYYLDDSTGKPSPANYYKGNYTGRTNYLGVYENIKKGHIEMLAGLDYHYYNTDQDALYVFGGTAYPSPPLKDSLAHMSLFSAYASAVFHQNGLDIELGGRWNHHSLYGNNVTYSFNPSYLINQKVKLFSNISSAFKTPTLYQLYDPSIGNKNLQAELSTVFEGGLEVYFSVPIKARANYFYGSTNHAIQFIYTDPTNYIGSYQNVNNQKRYGLETEVTIAVKRLNVVANYTYTAGSITSAYGEDGTPIAKDTLYNNLYRVPNHMANAFITYKVSAPFSISMLLKYMSKRLEPVYLSKPLINPQYFTIDLSFQYMMSQKIKAFADFRNLTNKRYFDVLGYNARRFNFTAGLQIGL